MLPNFLITVAVAVLQFPSTALASPPQALEVRADNVCGNGIYAELVPKLAGYSSARSFCAAICPGTWNEIKKRVAPTSSTTKSTTAMSPFTTTKQSPSTTKSKTTTSPISSTTADVQALALKKLQAQADNVVSTLCSCIGAPLKACPKTTKTSTTSKQSSTTKSSNTSKSTSTTKASSTTKSSSKTSSTVKSSTTKSGTTSSSKSTTSSTTSKTTSSSTTLSKTTSSTSSTTKSATSSSSSAKTTSSSSSTTKATTTLSTSTSSTTSPTTTSSTTTSASTTVSTTTTSSVATHTIAAPPCNFADTENNGGCSSQCTCTLDPNGQAYCASAFDPESCDTNEMCQQGSFCSPQAAQCVTGTEPGDECTSSYNPGTKRRDVVLRQLRGMEARARASAQRYA